MLGALDEVASVVDDVFAAVADWDAMHDRVVERAGSLAAQPPPHADADDVAEAATFLEWLADDHFTFVGSVPTSTATARWCRGRSSAWRARRAVVRDATPPIPRDGLAARAHHVAHAVPPSTATCRSTSSTCATSRPTARSSGETQFFGLYTANVYSQSAETIPLLRRKVAQVMERSGFPPAGHDGRTLAHVLETYPRDELFRLGLDELADPSASCAWGCAGASGSS